MASKVWKLLWVADNQIDNNRKMQSLPPYKISSTNRQKDCYAGRCCGEHKMVLRYAFCKAQECGSKCPVCYCHIFCDSKQKWYLYQEEATFHVHQPFNETEYTGYANKEHSSICPHRFIELVRTDRNRDSNVLINYLFKNI
jgi:hypothetical protein